MAEEKNKLKQLYTEFYQQLVEAVSDPDTCHSLTTQLHSTSLLSEEKKAVLSSSLASGSSFLKVLGVEEEPHLLTVLMEMEIYMYRVSIRYSSLMYACYTSMNMYLDLISTQLTFLQPVSAAA